jgi:Tol biopolymer transport system component
MNALQLQRKVVHEQSVVQDAAEVEVGVRPEEIEGALSGIHNSQIFSKAERAREFLAYLVRRFPQESAVNLTAGTPYRDNEQTHSSIQNIIACEFFGKTEFNAATDSLVRTNATRLRKALEKYYGSEGKDDPVRIDIPLGIYIPHLTRYQGQTPAELRERSAGEPKTSARSDLNQASSSNLRFWALRVLLILLVFSAGLVFRRKPDSGTTETRNWHSPYRVTFENVLAMSPAISRDGQMLVYAAETGTGNLVLWLKDLHSNVRTQITEGSTDDYDPDISPDGSEVVFRSERDQGGVYVVPIHGGPITLLAKYARTPKFSPDGKWILYWEGEPYFKLSKMFIIPTRGGPPRRLQARFYGARYGVWSPDSTHILFWGGNESEWDWWVSSINDDPAYRTDASKAIESLSLDGPAAWVGDQVIFSASDQTTNLTRNLWSATIALAGTGQWKIAGPPVPLTNGAGSALDASVTPSGVIAFSNQESKTNIWEIPLNHDGTAGAERRLMDYFAREHSPSVPMDRSKIVFSSNRSGDFDVWLTDLHQETDHELRLGSAAAFGARISPDGKQVAYGIQGAQAWPIRVVQLDSGSKRTVCNDCGVPRSWSADGRWLLYETKQSEPFSVGVLNVASGDHAIIASSTFETYPDQFSPDVQWFSFHGRNTNRTRTIYIAPFRGLSEVPPQDWLAVTDGNSMDREGVWSPGQDILYFLSERDGFRCIWAQRLDRESHRAVGKPWPFRHFHRARYSLLNVGSTGDVGLTLANNRMTFSLTETIGSIWFLSRKKQ